MEDPGIRRGCRPGDKKRRVRGLRIAGCGLPVLHADSGTRRAPCGACRPPAAIPSKVLEGVILPGLSWCSKKASTTSTGPRANPGCSFSTSRPAGPRPWLVTSATSGYGLTPLPTAARFSIPGWTPRRTTSCWWKTSGEIDHRYTERLRSCRNSNPSVTIRGTRSRFFRLATFKFGLKQRLSLKPRRWR